MCKTDFAEVTGSSQTRIVNVLDIQFGGESGENFELEVDRMNSEILGIDNLSAQAAVQPKENVFPNNFFTFDELMALKSMEAAG